LPDISQNGNGSAFRNAWWKHPSVIPSTKLVNIEFDYASAFKLNGSPTDITVLCSILQASDVAPVDQLKALRMISHNLILTPEQCCELVLQLDYQVAPETAETTAENQKESFIKKKSVLGFVSKALRVDACVLLFARVCDYEAFVSKSYLYNEKFFSDDDTAAISSRLGIQTFDALRCSSKLTNVTGNKYVLDLTKSDNRLLLCYFLKCDAVEGCMKDAQWSEEGMEGEERIFTAAAWIIDTPDYGSFSFKYAVVGEATTNEVVRRKLARELLSWQ